MSMTARRSDSFWEKRPNWISSIVRVGALEKGKCMFAMTAVYPGDDEITSKPMSIRFSDRRDAYVKAR
jgi:hypothetical protein